MPKEPANNTVHGCKTCGWTKTGKTINCEEPTERTCWEPIFECWKPKNTAAPSESAMEVVRKIRLGGYALNANDPDDHGPNGDDYHFILPDSDAAALIEGYGRRVPSALFNEIIEIQPLSYAKLGRAFVKHGVRCEP